MTNTNILTNLPQQRQEKIKKIAAIIVVAILLILFAMFVIGTNVAADYDTDSKQIADYEYQINELRKEKEKCFDDLSYEETKSYLNWFTKPCVNWDEQIMELRAKADELKAKSYDVGLM